MVFKGSFEDILFIILGFIWIIYSAYKSKSNNKKINNDDVTGEESSSVNKFDDLLAEMVGIENVEKEKFNDSLANESVPIKAESEFIFDDKEVDNSYLQDEYDINYGENVFKNSEIGKESGEKNISFNLKKALIYSEILKRKYI